jgi:hypothetical protein
MIIILYNNKIYFDRQGETICQRYPSVSQIIPIGNYSAQGKASLISSRKHSKIIGKKINHRKNNQRYDDQTRGLTLKPAILISFFFYFEDPS